MRYFAGYIGCAGIFLLLLGVMFRAFILPALKPRKKPVLEWIVIAVFSFGMLESMATKPGNSPRRAPRSNVGEGDSLTNVTEILESPATNSFLQAPFAIRYIHPTATNVTIGVSWPSDYFGHDTIMDCLVAYPTLTNEWQWLTQKQVPAGHTNCTFTITSAMLGMSEMPTAFFAKVADRVAAASTMDDVDGDGTPGFYELEYGTNPYVADSFAIEPLVCTNADYNTLMAVLNESEPYSIVYLPTGTIVTAESILIPPHPILLSGPRGGYCVIESSAKLGAFRFADGQDERTLVRNVYLALRHRGEFQVGFWCGGNLPWEGQGATPSFQNVNVRASRPDTEYIGWLFYGDNGKTVSLANCLVNAKGALIGRGVESGNGPVVDLCDYSCVNASTNFQAILSRNFRVGGVTTNAIIQTGHEATVFVDMRSGVDSDNDGLPDITEATILGTDPWLADSDGDGVTDPDELLAETDPTEVSFFHHYIYIHVERETMASTAPIRLFWSKGDEALVEIGTSTAASFDKLLELTNGFITVTAWQDLNGNGNFDLDNDICLTRAVAGVGESVHIEFKFGDVDGDLVSDQQERLDGTDPYSAESLRIIRTAYLSVADFAPSVTNYYAVSASPEQPQGVFPYHFTATYISVPIDMNAIAKAAFVYCFRDFNCNGIYDKGIEPLYAFRVVNFNPDNEEPRNLTFAIADRDNDSVCDSDEYVAGTDPSDSRSYRYSPTLTVTGIFMTTNNLVCQAFFGTNAIGSARTVTTNVETFCASDLSTGIAEQFEVHYWEDYNGNMEFDEGEPMTKAVARPNGVMTVLTIDLPYGQFDVNKNKIPDWWEYATGLNSSQESHNWYDDTDHDGLINLHEYWTNSDPLSPDGSNTVLSILARSIDDRLTGDPMARKPVFNNYYHSSLERNANCWAYGIDLSCASPYNSFGGTQRAGTAISRQHIVFADHFAINTNKYVYFSGCDGEIVVRTIIDRKRIGNTDIMIALLDQDLPLSVSPAYLLPSDFQEFLGQGKGLPMLMLDQQEHALVADVNSLPFNTASYSSGIEPLSIKRKAFFEQVVSGDSGNPSFLVFGTNVILVHTFHYGGGGAGPFLSNYVGPIQSAMNDLSTSNGFPCKAISFVDFSTLPKLVKERK